MKGIIHGGFKGLGAPKTRAAWQAFFNAMAPQNPCAVFLLPWALSVKSWAGAENTLRARAAEFWDVTFEIYKYPDAISLEKALTSVPENKDILVYLPGGILAKQAISLMSQLDSAKAPERTVFAGVSAGAYCLMNSYYNPRTKEIASGGGIFKGGVCCHADRARKEALTALKNQKPQPFYILTDGVFEVVENNN